MALNLASAVAHLHSMNPPVLRMCIVLPASSVRMSMHACLCCLTDRDIKSKNVLIAAGNVLKLTDFGEAKVRMLL